MKYYSQGLVSCSLFECCIYVIQGVFSDHIPDVSRGRLHYYSQSSSACLPIDYDGIPFMHVGRWTLICHQGKDLGSRNKSKYIEKKKLKQHEQNTLLPSRKSSSKKVDCPARIYVSHIVKYPQFSVPGKILSQNSLPSDQLRRAIKKKMSALYKQSCSKLALKHFYYLRLPLTADHKGHPFITPVPSTVNRRMVVSNISTLDRRKTNKNRDRHRRTREPVDGRVLEKLNSLVKAGYCSVSAIRGELNR